MVSDWRPVGHPLVFAALDSAGDAMKLVKVTWHDAEDNPDTWVDEKDAQEYADALPTEVVSLGFLIKRTEKFLTIAADSIERDQRWGRLTKIPLGMVISVDEIQ